MTDKISQLKALVGEEFLKQNTSFAHGGHIPETSQESSPRDQQQPDALAAGESEMIYNSKDVVCKCKTIILKANQATLMLSSESMLDVERDLSSLKLSDNFFDSWKRGCYWLVDDMYKFEQIGYTKEIDPKHLRRETVDEEQNSESCPARAPAASQTSCMRYLVCADCNICPLGWFDSNTKESYLFVW